MLGPPATTEVLYRALQTPAGATIRRFARQGHVVSRVQPAIAWIRSHVAEPLVIEDLAARTHLSTSTLYRHFRSATGLSPLQFQKQIRLQEARRLLFLGGATAADAGFQVGYLSASQFSREYARMFGRPPGQDATRTLNAIAAQWQPKEPG